MSKTLEEPGYLGDRSSTRCWRRTRCGAMWKVAGRRLTTPAQRRRRRQPRRRLFQSAVRLLVLARRQHGVITTRLIPAR